MLSNIEESTPVTDELFQDAADKLENEKRTVAEFASILKKSLTFWTVSVVASFVGCAVSVILLLTSFSSNTALAVFGTIGAIVLFALGLVINGYTKHESNFLCRVKRCPLGYMLRTTVSKRVLIIGISTAASTLVISVAAVILATAGESAALLITLVAALLVGLGFAVVAFLVYNRSRDYIVKNQETFIGIENDFATKTHRI